MNPTTIKRGLSLAGSLAILMLGTVLTGCTTAENGALVGGGVGAGTGAIIGSTVGHSGTGALLGLGIGALTGALFGDAVDHSYQAGYYNGRRDEAGPPPRESAEAPAVPYNDAPAMEMAPPPPPPPPRVIVRRYYYAPPPPVVVERHYYAY